uniref:Cyclin-dependent kinase like 5 n=1 Tax=Dimocarpus longan TaxID=128017 RepID=A0A8G0VTG3_9ROSI|nr:cyclin-dependent kinase like 5 [Dimocarpus longan]
MGCICSKGTAPEDEIDQSSTIREKEMNISSVQLVAPAPSLREDVIVKVGNVGGGINENAVRVLNSNVSCVSVQLEDGNKRTMIIERPKKGQHQRCLTMDTARREQKPLNRIESFLPGAEGTAEIAAGWPEWLTSVAGEAIKGWVPRRSDSFEKLEKVGQGTYSSVYKARDLETGKIVALKKVRFVNMDPESVRFMAREILILRKLDHPNVMKLEFIITSRMSDNLYLVFEYMEHDLAGLATTPGNKLTESQIKCYMQQLFRGLEHCHSRGVLHRDIKGSNLLINNDGVLKIGDFGLATFYEPNQKQPLTSRVVTLWYRAPELLLGATQYGVAIDMWSAGCIVAELFAGKPIMPGRTEVEQMHKILKLCGSPSVSYWEKNKSAHSTSFKPQHPYKRCVAEAFRTFPYTALALVDKLLAIEPEERGSAAAALRSEFFTTEPLPCDPSSLPKYYPSKELDVKLRNEEARRQRADAIKGRGPESIRRGDLKAVRTPEFSAQGQPKTTSVSHKYNAQDEGGSGFLIEPPRGAKKNGYSQPSSVVHPNASWSKNTGSARNNAEFSSRQRIQMHHAPDDSSKRNDRMTGKESTMAYVPKKNRMHYSGPLMPPGGNMEDILKEHERQIQQAVRKARGTNKTNDVYDLNGYGKYQR